MFKVKTTEPNNYIVRPNQGVITPESSVMVRVICQLNIIEVGPLLTWKQPLLSIFST